MLEYCQLYFKQFIQTLPMHKDGFEFIKKYQPWKGMEKYSWSARVLLIASVLLGYFFFKDAFIAAKELINTATNSQAGLAFFTDFSFEKIDWALKGTKKYLILIVLEIFTFHFVQKVLEIKTGRKPSYTFSAFFAAEKRMLKASLSAWIKEIIFIALAKALIGIIGLGFLLNDPVSLLIQFYFLGFIIIDNYHECFGLTLKESSQKTKQVAGVAIAIGGVAYCLMFVPLIGVVAATMIGAVTATLAMERFAPMEVANDLV
jgi:hypothetical protein